MQALNSTMVGRFKRATKEVARSVQCDSEFGRITKFAKRALNADNVIVMLTATIPALDTVAQRLCEAVTGCDALLAVPDIETDARFRAVRGLCAGRAGFLGMPLHGPDGFTNGVLCVFTSSPRIWSREDQEMLTFLGSEIDATMRLREAKESEARRADEQSLVAREYHHRIRNAFSVSTAIVCLSGVKGGSVQDLVESSSAQLSALADAHTSLEFGRENLPVSSLVQSALKPYGCCGATISAHGSAVTIDAAKIVPLSLIFTELATNSTKHGALGKSGSVAVTWAVLDGEIVLRWREHSTEQRSTPLKREGSFGGTMVDIAVSQLGATLERNWLSDGLEVTLTFPI